MRRLITELNLRDSCGKSPDIIRNYYYYNKFTSSDFSYNIKYNEKPLIDIIDGDENIFGYIPKLIPYIVFIGIGIIYLIPCIFLWYSITCCPLQCCLLKPKKLTKYILSILFHVFSICVIVLCILIMTFLLYNQKLLNGMMCGMQMLIYNAINGQGILAKKDFDKPYWYRISSIKTILTDTSDFIIGTLTTGCTTFMDTFTPTKASTADTAFTDNLDNIYNTYSSKTLTNYNPNTDLKGSVDTIIPSYIQYLGNYTTSSTYLNRVYKDYTTNYNNATDNLNNIYVKCNLITAGSSAIKSSFNDITKFVEDVDKNLQDLSTDMIDKVVNYINSYQNYLYYFYFGFVIVFSVLLIIENIFLIFYRKRPYTHTKDCLTCFFVFINAFIIFLFIFSSIFGLLSKVLNDVGDIIDFVFSDENFKSKTPRIITSDVEDLMTCIFGDGYLLPVFVSDTNTAVTQTVESLNYLYGLYYLIGNQTANFSSTEENSQNTLQDLDLVITELTNMKTDIILAVDSSTYGENSILQQFNELNKYTIAGRKYQNKCALSTYDYWTTTSSRCPKTTSSTDAVNIYNSASYIGQCLYPSYYF